MVGKAPWLATLRFCGLMSQRASISAARCSEPDGNSRIGLLPKSTDFRAKPWYKDPAMDPLTNYGGHATAEQALDEVVHLLVEAMDPVAIYLFGSRARGDARPDSDFDLMVITRPEEGAAGYDYGRAYAPLVGRGIACDVLPVPVPDFLEDKDDPTSLCFEAAHRGRKVYERRTAN